MSALMQLRHAVNPGGCVIVEGAAIIDRRKWSMNFLYGPEMSGPRPGSLARFK
jgi:hypothetical protein